MAPANNPNSSRRDFVKQIGTTAILAAQDPSLVLPSFGVHQGTPINIGPICLDPGSGCPVSINNCFTEGRYPLAGWRFEIQVNAVSLKPETARKVGIQRSKDGARVIYDYPDYEVVHIVNDGPNAGFAESRLRVRDKAGASIYVRRVMCGEFVFAKTFDEIIRHTDGTFYETPINLFLRAQKGGAILGVAYPYQELAVSAGGKTITLAYDVQAQTPAGEEFQTEPLFVGTYAYSGLGIYKPFEKVAYRFVTPDPQERDLGEIWAMQGYVRCKVPFHPVRNHNQFFMFLNSWWAGLPLEKLAPAIDLMASLGVSNVGTRESYFGIAGHISPSKDLENLPDRYRIPLPEAARTMIAYGRTKGVNLLSFVAPCRPFRAEWEWRSKEGKPSMYGAIRSVCFASREAADFALGLWDRMIRDSGTDYFGFDGRFLTSFNETDLGARDPAWGPPGPMPCYAGNHGHKPGHNFYQDYKNVQYILSELRRRNPGIFLEVYWGLKRAYPWALASLNGCENLYESNGHQDDRMQSWYNQNYKFLPNYVNFAQIRGYTDAELRKEILSAISISSHLQIGVGVKLLEKPHNQEFFRKWSRWAAENHEFLNVKRDLFGQPWSVPLDGSAHLIADKGYLFLFNECASDQVGSVPFDERIGLTEGDSFDVRQIYPDERWLQRGVRQGTEVLIPTTASGVSIVAVEPSSHSKAAMPEVVWHNLRDAEVKFSAGLVDISGLEGYEGQRREIAVLTSGATPTRLRVNGRVLPSHAINNLILAEVQFAEPETPQPLSLESIWPAQLARFDNSGAFVIETEDPVRSVRTAGSGIYEIDMICDFDAGGFFFKADRDEKKGVLAAAMLSRFPPTDGNIGFWDVNFPQFPVTWTLGKSLKKGEHYRFRIASYSDRHCFSVLDPGSGRVLIEPLTYCINTVEPRGLFGIRLKKGKARITRLAVAEASLTSEIRAVRVSPARFIQHAFISREITRKMGQHARPGTKKVIGRDSFVQFDYTKEQERMWSAK